MSLKHSNEGTSERDEYGNPVVITDQNITCEGCGCSDYFFVYPQDASKIDRHEIDTCRCGHCGRWNPISKASLFKKRAGMVWGVIKRYLKALIIPHAMFIFAILESLDKRGVDGLVKTLTDGSFWVVVSVLYGLVLVGIISGQLILGKKK